MLLNRGGKEAYERRKRKTERRDVRDEPLKKEVERKEGRIDNKTSHPSFPIMSRHQYSVNIGFQDSCDRRYNCLHLTRGHILSLPSKGISDSVDKVHESILSEGEGEGERGISKG